MWTREIPRCMHTLFSCAVPSIATVSCGFLARFLVSILQGIAVSIKTSYVFLAFLLVSSNSPPSGSIKIDASQFSSIVELWILHSPFLLLLLLYCSDIPDHISGHKSSGLAVAWIFVRGHPDHTYPFGSVSVTCVNFVDPVP